MLTSFIIIILVLWHQALPTIAEITDAEYSSYADSLRKYRQGMTPEKKEQLRQGLRALYGRWTDPNHPYPTEFTSITGLLIEAVIPKKLCIYMVANAVEPTIGMSLAHNEFVWEGLKTIHDFTYFSYDDVHRGEIQHLRALTAAYEERLKAQIRIQLFGQTEPSEMSTLSAKLTQSYVAKESRPWVSSFTQVEIIKMNWLNWCVDEFNVDTTLARFTEMDEDTVRELKRELVDVLASIQLVAGRIELIQSSLAEFNVEHPSIPVGQLINDMESLKKSFAECAQKYRSITWKHVLGTDVSYYFGIIASAPLATPGLEDDSEASRQADPRKVQGIPDEVLSLFLQLPPPENVPPEYLELAKRFHKLVVDRGIFIDEWDEQLKSRFGDTSTLYERFNEAASAARLSQVAGSTDDGSWPAPLLEDARQLRDQYATAADARYRFYAASLREYRDIGMPHEEKEQLRKEMEALYVEWRDITDSYGSGIASITCLLIAAILPKNIPFTEDNLREPHNGMSLAHNEFVWEALETLASAYWPDNGVSQRVHEVIRDLAPEYQKQLMDQIRPAFFGCADVLKAFVACSYSSRVAQAYSALESAQRPRVSSFTQVELIMSMWIECSGEISSSFTPTSIHMSDEDLGNVLSSLQSVVARMQLMELSLLAFLSECIIPQTAWWKMTIKAWSDKGYAMQRTTSDYNYRSRWYLQCCPCWTAAHGTEKDAVSLLEFLEDGRDSRGQGYLRLETQFCNFIIARLPENPLITNSRFSTITLSKLNRLSPEAASAARLRECGGATHDSFMADHIGVYSVGARGHGASTSHDSR
ncbi:hypothetical protein SeLEV6574_g04557, partial [Synchytrium endobioticum]